MKVYIILLETFYNWQEWLVNQTNLFFGFTSMTVNLFNIFVTILVYITHCEKQYPIHGNISFSFRQNYVWIFMPYMQVS